MYSPISIFQTKNCWFPPCPRNYFNLEQTGKDRIPILDEVPNVQRLHISHCFIFEFLPEIKWNQVLNSQTVIGFSVQEISTTRSTEGKNAPK